MTRLLHCRVCETVMGLFEVFFGYLGMLSGELNVHINQVALTMAASKVLPMPPALEDDAVDLLKVFPRICHDPSECLDILHKKFGEILEKSADAPESGGLKAYVAGSAVLAAIRGWNIPSNSWQPNDIDVWFTYGLGKSPSAIGFDEIARTFPFFAEKNIETTVKTYTFVTQWKYMPYWKGSKPPINGVCFLGDIRQVVSQFDLDICKIWYDGKTLWGTRDFVEAYQRGLSSVTPYRPDATDSQYRSPARLRKYAERGFFPGPAVYQGDRPKGCAMPAYEVRVESGSAPAAGFRVDPEPLIKTVVVTKNIDGCCAVPIARLTPQPHVTVWGKGGLGCDVQVRCIGSLVMAGEQTPRFQWPAYRACDNYSQ